MTVDIHRLRNRMNCEVLVFFVYPDKTVECVRYPKGVTNQSYGAFCMFVDGKETVILREERISLNLARKVWNAFVSDNWYYSKVRSQ